MRVERARILLGYHADPSTTAVGMRVGVTHHTVHRCLLRAVRLGVLASLDDSPRPGKAPDMTAEARAWLVSLACRKARELGYPHELWTTRLLARHAREHAASAGHPSLANIVQGTVCKILASGEIKPHKIRYYLGRRDEAFEAKMAEVLCVYREVAILKQSQTPDGDVAIISYDEKPGIRRSAPPLPTCRHSLAGTRPLLVITNTNATAHSACSLLTEIDLLTGRAHRGAPPLARVHRISQGPRCSLSRADCHQADPRQPLSPHFQGNQGPGPEPARRTLLLRVYAQARILAQPRRRVLLQNGKVDAPPYSRYVQGRAQRTHPRLS